MSGQQLKMPLHLWVQERLHNCLRLASTCDGRDRAGWLEDAAYFRAILTQLKNRAH